MSRELLNLLDGPGLPEQSMVFCIYDLARKCCSVCSFGYTIEHSIVRALNDDLWNLCKLDQDEVLERYGKNPILGRLDEAGFYNGLSGDEVLELSMTTQEKKKENAKQRKKKESVNTESFTACVGMPRLSLGTAVPYARFEYNAWYNFQVSARIEPHDSYVVVKLDGQLPWGGVQLRKDLFIPEISTAKHWSTDALAVLRKCASGVAQVSIMKAVGTGEVSPAYLPLMVSARTWPVTDRGHFKIP